MHSQVLRTAGALLIITDWVLYEYILQNTVTDHLLHWLSVRLHADMSGKDAVEHAAKHTKVLDQAQRMICDFYKQDYNCFDFDVPVVCSDILSSGNST